MTLFRLVAFFINFKKMYDVMNCCTNEAFVPCDENNRTLK